MTVGSKERLGRRRPSRWMRCLVRAARPVRSRAINSHLPPRSTELNTVSSLLLELLNSEHCLSSSSRGNLLGEVGVSLSVSLNAGGLKVKYFTTGSVREFSHLAPSKLIFPQGS